MPEFETARDALRQAQATLDEARSLVIGRNEAVKAAQRAAEGALRGVPAGKREEMAERLAGQIETREGARTKARTAFEQAARLRDKALFDFVRLLPPEKAVARLSDSTPIALFPLRLETRYGRGAGEGGPQLWVRVYPDDILVDSFQHEISTAEYANTRVYWINHWRATGDEAGRRAAWVALARAHGSGRARWLLQRIAPADAGGEPSDGSGTAFLVVQPQIPVGGDERDAFAEYLLRLWKTRGDDSEAALQALEAATGAARGAELAASLTPENLPGLLSADPRPDEAKVVYLDLPLPSDLPMSESDWTRGARVAAMPERLVLMGFRDGAKVLEQVGQPVPPDLAVGPDPSLADADQTQADGEDLGGAAADDWTVNFDEAVARGMGFRVDLPDDAALHRFDRLFVLGVRTSETPEDGAASATRLISNHAASRKGFAILPQGQPTNNTDDETSGYSWWEDLDAAYDDFVAGPAAGDAGWRTRSDGGWLTGLLGLQPEALSGVSGTTLMDGTEARAMNAALYPATLGYYLEQMLPEVIDEDTRGQVRDYFLRFVIGRGPLPLVRVGRQPYGIVPATAWSRLNFWNERRYVAGAKKLALPAAEFLTGLDKVVTRAAQAWDAIANGVSHVGDPGREPQQTLLDILGLHPTSVEFYQRYSQSFTQYRNLLALSAEPVSEPLTAQARRYIEAGLLALAELGWTMSAGGDLPGILEKIFLKIPNLLKGDLVAPELSETEGLAVQRSDGRTYLDWLAFAARQGHDVLRRQEGFDDGPPGELLYLMLHHALDLGYVDGGIDLSREALDWDTATVALARKEPTFIAVKDKAAAESRWARLYQPLAGGTTRLGDLVAARIGLGGLYLGDQLSALDRLVDVPTARLERAFVEHLDCLSYRLDAWRIGMHSVQMAHMRQDGAEGMGQGGLYIGAYGWVENLAPEARELGRVELDAELAAVFDPDGTKPVFSDSSNAGSIHAPSLDHAVTAAILRNGYLANATPETPDLLAVDLSSERVRLAQQMLEGLRNGQSLGALLGYVLERRLHDEPGLFLDALIYDLRRAFPLAGNRNLRTRVAGVDIRKAEARNVVDGLALAGHVDADPARETYPYGLSLPPLSDFVRPGGPSAGDIGRLIDGHVAMIRSIGDAVADLSLAEGLYQLVRGNYDRAAGSMEAFSKGLYPPEAQITQTPTTGPTLTHRVALHLRGGMAPTGPTPRAALEPALAEWIALHLPPLDRVFARVTWTNGDGVTGTATPDLAALGLHAADLFYLVGTAGERELTGFDDLLIDHAEQSGIVPAPRHDATYALEFHPSGIAAPGMTLFELAPLVRALRGLILGARPLRATDLAVTAQEATTADDAVQIARPDKPAEVRGRLVSHQAPIQDFVDLAEPLVGEAADPDAAAAAAAANVDAWLSASADLARRLVPFGMRAASLTAPVEQRRRPYGLLVALLADIETRFAEKADAFDAVMVEYAALDGGATEAERHALLLRAFRTVSTGLVDPVPPTVPQYETLVANTRSDFDSLRATAAGLVAANPTVGALFAAVEALVPSLAGVDLKAYDLTETKAAILAVCRRLLAQARQMVADIDRRLEAADAALAMAALSAGETAHGHVETAAKALLGEAALVLPEFTPEAPRKVEWFNAWTDREAIRQHLTGAPGQPDFPLDDWLHGLARVRERMAHLEAVQQLAPLMGATGESALETLQFPYRPDDVWLGMDFPDTFRDGTAFRLEGGKLLYTCIPGAGTAPDLAVPAQTVTGLLLDEWSEVIPDEVVTTGVAFHHDRPNTEPPQAILLVTPPISTGSWNWDDIVDAMHETLDFSRLRAVEPDQLARSAFAPLVPAILSSVTGAPITAALNFAENNKLSVVMEALRDG